MDTNTAVETDVAAEQEQADGQDMMTPETLATLCDQRALTYSLLARLFRKEVDQKMLSELVETSYPVSTGNDLMDQGYYKIAKYLSNEWVDPISKLSIDYSKTFLGAGIDAYSAAYPYESVYTSEKRLLMQDARDEVLAIYRANGLDKADSFKESEDHLAVELEFMRIMSERAAKALRNGNEDRAFSSLNTSRNFINDHISVWVPVFTSEMRRFASTLFYQGLADLTEGYLAEDKILLNELVEEDESDEAGDEAAEGAEVATVEEPRAGARPQADTGVDAAEDASTGTVEELQIGTAGVESSGTAAVTGTDTKATTGASTQADEG